MLVGGPRFDDNRATVRVVATNPPPELVLTPLVGPPKTIEETLTMFHLLLVVLDPFTNESAWILRTAQRVLHTFRESDCRVGYVITGTADDARLFLGERANDISVYLDRDRELVKGLGLATLPAIVHLGMDGTVVNAAEGWGAAQWKGVTDPLARVCSWAAPVLPEFSDPGAFAGSPST